MSKTQKSAELHDRALRQFDQIQSALYAERQQCLSDRRFCSIVGAQWEGPIGEQFENKPKLEVNKVHLAVMRIISEYRNNRITVDFVSKDGTDRDELADVCDGLYRADEQDSVANEAYDNAFEEACAGGFGAWRLRAEYEEDEDEDDTRQRIRIEPIFDADTSVYFDLQAKRQDKADAKFCFVLTSMTPEAFEEEWGDDPQSWPKQTGEAMFDWATPDVVYVAEYYVVQERSEMVYWYIGLDGSEVKLRADEMEEQEPDMLALGYTRQREKRVKTKAVHKWILSGGGVLEDCGIIAGKNIPIVPVYGKRWFVDNVERCMGHVRLAKDAQRLKNMQLSKLAEISALSSVQKPIFTGEQMAGHQLMWSEDNIKNYPYLLVNAVTDASGNSVPAGPVAYTQPAAIPPAMAALLQVTEADMQDLLGNQQQGDKIVSNISGKAVEMIQTRLDMQSAIYMSNMAKAVQRSGEIWLSMASDILVEPKRRMKTVGSQGKVNSIELMVPKFSEEGEIIYENDLSEAKFDVAVEVGPASSSKRAATVRELTGMMQVVSDPETQQVLQALIMFNMEGEGVTDAREFYRKRLVKMGVIPPSQEEEDQMIMEAQAQGQDANTKYLEAAAEEAQAQAVKARADVLLTVAKAEETKAKTAQIITEIENADAEAAISTISAIDKMQLGGQ